MKSNEQEKKKVPAPRLRFKQFEGAGVWEEKELFRVIKESRIPAEDELGKRLTVSLHLKGVSVRSDHSNSEVGKTIYYHRKAGQFIYGKQNIFRGSIGIVPDKLDNYLSSQDLPAFDVADGTDVNFLYNYFARVDFYESLEKLATGTGSKRVQPEKLYKLKVPFPPLPEQTHIAACLSSLDAVIDAHTDKLEALRQHKRALMQQLFPQEGEKVPRLRFPEFEGAGEWEEKKLGEVCARIMDGTHFSPKSTSGSYKYLTSKNIKDGCLDLSNLSYISEEEHNQIYKRCPVKFNDILLTKDGANTGNCALNNLEEEFSLLSSVAVIRGNPKFLTQEFVFQTILSENFQNSIQNAISGQAITRITLEKIGRMPISLPTLPEQTRIAACLSSLDDLISAQADKVAGLREFKRGLMQGLFPSTTNHEATE